MNAPHRPPAAHELLEGLLLPPSVPSLSLKRTGLCEWALKRLEMPGHVVAAIAPAGYAKTSLLRQLHAERQRKGGRVAWLSFAADSNEPEILLDYLGAAIASATDTGAGTRQPATLAGLLNSIARQKNPVTLFLDNFETLLQPRSVRVLQDLLRGAPPTLRMMIAGRRNPGLSFTSLLAERRMSLVDPSELAFSFGETAEFVILESGSSPGAVALNEIFEKTQGWPGLLSLIISSLPRAIPLETAVRDRSLSKSQVWAYINEEALAGQSAEDIRVMQVLALVPAADERMMRFVQQGERSPSVEGLTSRNPLIRSGGAGTYFLHPILRECIRSQLFSNDHARFVALSQRLAEWYENQNDAPSAIDCWVEANDLPRAIALLETNGRDIALEGFPDRCLRWLERLHPEHLEKHPGLQLTEVWARVTMHETNAAAALLNSAQVQKAKRRTPAFNIEVMTATAFAQAISDKVDAAMAAVEAVPRSARELSPIVAAGCASVQAWVQFSRGQFNEARDTLYTSGALDMQGQGLLTHAYACLVSGECHAAEGQLETAEGIFRRAVKYAEDQRGRRSMVAVVNLGPLLELLYERDQIDEVLALASGREHLRLKYSTPASSTAAGVALAHALTLRNAAAEATELLDDMLRVGEENHLPRIVAHALSARIEIAIREGKLRHLADPAGRLDGLRNDSAGLLTSPQGVINYLARLSRIRILVARSEYAEAGKAAAALSAKLSSLPYVRASLMVDTIVAWINWKVGDSKGALAAFSSVLERAAPLELVRSLIDQMSDSTLLDSPQLKRTLPGSTSSYVDRLKKAMVTSPSLPPVEHRMISPGSGWTDATLSGGKTGFTTREREILFLLAREIPIKRIAQTLRISPETAKWHTKNIYEKLGVHDRASALLVVRRLQAATETSPS